MILIAQLSDIHIDGGRPLRVAPGVSSMARFPWEHHARPEDVVYLDRPRR